MAVRFRGRVIDPVALWANYVEFPANFDGVGENYAPLVKCPNPDHHTEKRHFQVNLKKDLVHCFAECGISGSYEHAISMVEGVTHREARRRILRHSRIGTTPDSPARRKTAVRDAQPTLDNRYDTYIPAFGMEYLDSRRISSESVSTWELGWDAESQRIVIPAKDIRGTTRFLIRRAVKPKDQPKYLYPDDSKRSHLLFGACQIDLGMVESQGIVLVEGSIDTIIQHQNGFQNTGGILGGRLSLQQAKIIMKIRPPRIYTMFDPDTTGIDATFSVRRHIAKIPIFVCRYPPSDEKLDPAKLSREQAERMISRALPYGQWLRRLNARSPKSKTKERISSSA